MNDVSRPPAHEALDILAPCLKRCLALVEIGVPVETAATPRIVPETWLRMRPTTTAYSHPEPCPRLPHASAAAAYRMRLTGNGKK
jgi:hypothetical protein